MLGAEFESLPPAVKQMLTELAKRVTAANVLIEDCKVASDQAMRFFHNELTEDQKWQKESVPAKGAVPDLSARNSRAEDGEDLRPVDDEDE
jgi:hypothetical protein